MIKGEISPLIDAKLSKNKRNELEEAILSKIFGKEPFIDKYSEKEFQRLWEMIPSELQNQKAFKRKEGQVLGYIHKHIPTAYKSIAINFTRGIEVDYLSLIDVKDIDFSFLKDKEDS